MKVKDLILELARLDGDREVVIVLNKESRTLEEKPVSVIGCKGRGDIGYRLYVELFTPIGLREEQ